VKLIKSSNGEAAQTASVNDLQVNGAASVFSPAATPGRGVGPVRSTTAEARPGAGLDADDEDDDVLAA